MTHTSLTNIAKWAPTGAIILLIILSTTSYSTNATNIDASQIYTGKQCIINGGFSIQPDNTPIVTAITQSASPITVWLNGSSVHTAATAGHWQLPVTIQISDDAQPDTRYTVTLEGGSGSCWVHFGEIGFVTPSVIHSGEVMTFLFDVGAEIEPTTAVVARVI